MKLQLKHLAPYLPYKICGVCENEKAIELVVGLMEYEIVTDVDSIVWDAFKPILRPLSDLTKEIEHNGEKFVPIEKFCEIEDCRTEINIRDTQWGIKEIVKNGVQYDSDYGVVSHLFEWHFDVFGLIEQGLAIDINTIK